MILENMLNPKVSVIIPLYNKALYIRRAIDSILAQTVQDFEIIVVGGNSTDGSEDIVLNYYSDPRIRIVKESGKGVSAARNQGVNVARSGLVAFLDADDAWSPEFLVTILRMRERWVDAGMYSTGWMSVYSNGCKISSKCYGIGRDFEGIIPSVFKCAAIDGVFPGYTSSIVVPKEIFMHVGGFREDSYMGEDLDLWARISLRYSNAHCSQPLVYYHHDDEMAATNNLSLRQYREHPFQKSISEYMIMEGIGESELTPDLMLYMNSLNICLAMNCISLGNMVEARRLLKSVNDQELKHRKYVALVGTYIPQSLIKFVCWCLNVFRSYF